MTDKIISVYWFAILFIVAGAVVYMAAVFYGEPYDVREIEANIMINQIADCISQGGKIGREIMDEKGNLIINSDNVLEKCHFNFNVENFKAWNNDQYWINVGFYDFNTGNRLFPDITNGNINLKDWCDKKGKSLPKCVERSFYTLNKNNNQYIIKILSVVRKTEKNVG